MRDRGRAGGLASAGGGIVGLLAIVALPALAYDAGPVEAGGTIIGRVRYAGAAPSRGTLEVTRDVAVCGGTAKLAADLIVGPAGGLQNAVVSLPGITSGKAFDDTAPILDQRGCEYTPHVVLVPIGRALTILNPDNILHNVHTVGLRPGAAANPPINRAQPKFKTSMTEVFRAPEILRVSCDVHGWMQAWIVVQGDPYYAVTDAQGYYALTDVPPGDYALRIWHETLGESTRRVVVPPHGRVTVDADLGPR